MKKKKNFCNLRILKSDFVSFSATRKEFIDTKFIEKAVWGLNKNHSVKKYIYIDCNKKHFNGYDKTQITKRKIV